MMNRQLSAGTCIGHAIRSVRNNIGYAFRISWPWYAVMAPVVIILVLLANYTAGGNPETGSGMTILIDLFRTLITLVAFASIAVNWHRYILLDEVPQGSQVLRLDDKTWRYFGNMLLLFLILFGVGVVIGAPIGFIAALSGAVETVPVLVALLVAPVAGVMALRFGVKFPAIALGRRDFSMKHAWAATKGNNLPVFLIVLFELVVAVAAILLSALLAYLLSLVSTALGVVITVIVGLVINWVFTIFSITVLTSLYGFFVENREF
ncbi:hypothetical protein [Taklimakanibacter lacteus]|uniref:hypothetical protein n=1 Tax=Taklimakanibacter lacteus TaxID=2268456 RepID=UPI000E665FFF